MKACFLSIKQFVPQQVEIGNNKIAGKQGSSMLAELRMELETESSEFSGWQSSNMQGVLMEQIEPAYGEYLHEQKYHPYSQHLEFGSKSFWIINTLEKTAFENIMLPLLDEKFNYFELKKKNIAVHIKNKQVKTQTKRALFERFYTSPCSRFLDFEFLTPTSFKSGGFYQIIPELRLLYQSLMNKYSASCTDMEMFDETALEEMASNSRIVNYKLNSTCFYMEGIRIPAFRGRLGIKINGTDTMARYARFLLEFGEYSGVGIKTAMGMGALRLGGGLKR